MAVATNPVFPRTAVEQRLDWAGVPAREFPYDLITTYENMHATKAHPAYYREILSRLNRKPGECLMVGDDRQRDIEPAAGEGIPVFWVHSDAPPNGAADAFSSAAGPDRMSFGTGTLQQLLDLLRNDPPDPR
jgi:FMN phosphatase YigB (HAD superfamily)